MRDPRPLIASLLKRYPSVVLAVCVGVAWSVVLYNEIDRWDRGRLQSSLEQRARNYSAALQRELDRNGEVVRSIAGLFAASYQVERAEFHAFVKGALAAHTDIQALQWVPRVRDIERTSFEETAQREGLRQFRFTEWDSEGRLARAGWRREYFPVYYLEPMKGNEPLLGFDAAQDPVLRETLSRARKTGQMTSTPWVPLEHVSSGEYGFLLFQPVTRSQGPLDVFSGFSVGVFSASTMVEESLKGLGLGGIDIYLSDETASGERRALYRVDPDEVELLQGRVLEAVEAEVLSGFNWQTSLEVPGRRWALVFHGAPAFVAAEKSWRAWEALFGGLLLTAVLGVYLFTSARRAAALARINEELEREVEVRRLAEQVARESQARFFGILDIAEDAIISVGEDQRITLFNTGAEKIFGFKEEEVINKPLDVLLPPRLVEVHRAHVRDFAASEATAMNMSERQPVFGRRKDGGEFPAEASITKLEFRGEKVLTVFLRDITERVRSEKELRKVNRALRALSRSNRALVRASDEEELLQDICRIVVEEGGYRMAWVGFAGPGGDGPVRPRVRAGAEEDYLEVLAESGSEPDGHPDPTTMALRTGRLQVARDMVKDGAVESWRMAAVQQGFTSVIALPLREGESTVGALTVYASEPDAFEPEEVGLLEELAGDMVFGMGTLRMREERRRAEEELKEAYVTLKRAQASAVAAEKLAAVGRLTAGVSHELLNPLFGISATIHAMLKDPSIPGEIAEDLAEMREQTHRIGKIAQDLLSFSRQRRPERTLVDVNSVVGKSLSLIEHDLKLKGVSLELELSDAMPRVSADQDQIGQVLINLLTNARDAVPPGGRIRLTTRTAPPVFLGDKALVELRVQDSGPGIAPENLDKIFEPFFTTKPEGEGTGLGLAICHGIVEAHGGRMWAENAPEGGAVFVMQLHAEE